MKETNQRMDPSKSKSKIASRAVSTALILSAAGLVAMLFVVPYPYITRNMSPNDRMRVLSIKSPETTELKVPKVVHYIWLGTEPPAYIKEVIDFSTELANKQGFDVKFWNDSMVDDLMNSKYQLVKKQWGAIKNTTRHDRGTRLADVARYAVIHSEGGIYLDADFVPCADLNELVGPPGYASFPWTHLDQGRISNGIFSASPGHPLLARALAMLSKNNAITWFAAMNAAGPHFLAKAVEGHTNYNLANARKINPRDESSKIWYSKPMFKLRFGKPGAMARVNWIHLGYNTWFSGYKQGRSQCDKEENIHKIRPFLEVACFPKSHPGKPSRKSWWACA